MYVLKRDGRLEKFNREKIIKTCLRAGVPIDVAKEIAENVKREIYNRIPTEELYKIVLSHLRRFERSHAYLYRLKESVAELEPTAFEKFTKLILESLGYNAIWNVIIDGKCVDHQVDVVAEKDSKKYLIECKRHVNPHRFCGLGVGLQVQARLEDILDGFKEGKNKYNFYKAWIFTNTKFSEHIIRYADAKGILLTGWRYPENNGLEEIVQENKLLPVTLLPVANNIKLKLQEKEIITLNDFLAARSRKLEKCGISENRISSLRRIASEMLEKVHMGIVG